MYIVIITNLNYKVLLVLIVQRLLVIHVHLYNIVPHTPIITQSYNRQSTTSTLSKSLKMGLRNNNIKTRKVKQINEQIEIN